MPIQINGRTVGELRYARDDGSLAAVGEGRVWDEGRWVTVYTRPPTSLRTVTIEGSKTSSYLPGSWTTSTISGDISLVKSLTGAALSFVTPVVCDKDLAPGFKTSIGAGTVLDTHTSYAPDEDGRVVYTFTEVRT